MAEITFLNVDLDVESHHPLDALVESLDGDDAMLLHRHEARGLHIATFVMMADCESAEETILRYCELLENLPHAGGEAWRGCCARTFDMGFESGDSPSPLRSVLQPETVKRVADLGAAIAVTIYKRSPEDAGSVT